MLFLLQTCIRGGNNVGCSDDHLPEEFLNARVFTQLKSWMMLLEIQKEKLSSEIDSIRAELNKLHEKESKLRKARNQRKPELYALMENVRLFENETHLTCTMADVFVEKVTVYDKWCMEITWKCEDLVEKALNEVAEADEMVG